MSRRRSSASSPNRSWQYAAEQHQHPPLRAHRVGERVDLPGGGGLGLVARLGSVPPPRTRHGFDSRSPSSIAVFITVVSSR